MKMRLQEQPSVRELTRYIFEPAHLKSVHTFIDFHTLHSKWHASFSFKICATTIHCRDMYYGQVIIPSHIDYIINSKMQNFLWLREVGLQRQIFGVVAQEILEIKVSVLTTWLFKDYIQSILISDNLIVNYPSNLIHDVVHKMFLVFTKIEITLPFIIAALV